MKTETYQDAIDLLKTKLNFQDKGEQNDVGEVTIQATIEAIVIFLEKTRKEVFAVEHRCEKCGEVDIAGTGKTYSELSKWCSCDRVFAKDINVGSKTWEEKVEEAFTKDMFSSSLPKYQNLKKLITEERQQTLTVKEIPWQRIIDKMEKAKIPKPEDWHIISQSEANKQKNFNAGIQTAIEIVKKEV